MPFSLLLSILSLFSQTAIVVSFHSRLDLSFVGLQFLLWFCRHIHFAAKDVFVVTTGCRPVFFSWLPLFLSFSRRCSYCHGSTGSNAHTVVFSKPASYSPALFSIPVKDANTPTILLSLCTVWGKYGGCAVSKCSKSMIN